MADHKSMPGTGDSMPSSLHIDLELSVREMHDLAEQYMNHISHVARAIRAVVAPTPEAMRTVFELSGTIETLAQLGYDAILQEGLHTGAVRETVQPEELAFLARAIAPAQMSL